MDISLRRRNLQHLRALAEPSPEVPSSEPLDEDEVAKFYGYVKTVKPMLTATQKAKPSKDTTSNTRKGKRTMSNQSAGGSGHTTAADIFTKYVVDARDFEPIIGCDRLTATDFLAAHRDMLGDKKRGYLYRSRALALRLTMKGSCEITAEDWATAVGSKSRNTVVKSFMRKMARIGHDDVDTQVLLEVYEDLTTLDCVGEELHRMISDVLEKTMILIWLAKWDDHEKHGFKSNKAKSDVEDFMGKHQQRLTGERKLLIAAKQYGPIVALLSYWRLDGFRNKEHCAPAAKANDQLFAALQATKSTDLPAEERLEALFEPAYASLCALLEYSLGREGGTIANSLMTTVYKWDFGEDEET